MNKARRMAILKHRRRHKKLKEKRKALTMATGHGTVVTKPVAEVVQREKPPALKKKPSRKKKVEAAPVAETVSAKPAAKGAKAKVAKKEVAKKEIAKKKAPEPKKKPVRKKKTETTAES